MSSTLASATGGGGKMSSNKLTAMPMTNGGSYELYDGRAVHRMDSNSMEDDLVSPPGGPPGSPKQMKDWERTLMRSQQECLYLKKANEDLQKKLRLCSLSESPFNSDSDPQGNSADDIKDSQIRHLHRQVTIYQADLYKKEGLEQRMIEVTKEKIQLEDRLRAMAVQFENSKKEMHNMRDQLLQQITDLQATVRLQKEEIEQLVREKHAKKSNMSILAKEGYDSALPPSSGGSNLASRSGNHHHTHNQLISGTSMDSPAYHQELESLHKMVDALRATVIEQRNVFIKMGMASKSSTAHSMSQPSRYNMMSVSMPATSTQLPSRSEASASAASSDVLNTSNNIATTNTATASTLPPPAAVTSQSSSTAASRLVRQAEESCDLNTALSSNVSVKVLSSVDRGNSRENTPSPMVSSSGGENGNMNHNVAVEKSTVLVENGIPQLVQQNMTTGSGSPRRRKVVSADILPEMQDLNLNGRLVASASNSDYVNAASVSEQMQVSVREDSPVFGTGLTVGNQFALGDSDTLNVKTPPPQVDKSRKISRSEVIDRRSALPEAVLPPKSHTEVISRYPNSPSHYPQNQQQQHQQHQQQHQQQQHQQHQQQQHQQHQQQHRPQNAIRPGHYINAPPHPSDAVRLHHPQGVPNYPSSPPSSSPSSTANASVSGAPLQIRTGGVLPNPWQNGHLPRAIPAAVPTLPPFEAEGCIMSPLPASYSNTLSNISDVQSFPATPPDPQHRKGSTGRPQDNASNPNTNRLCPVCNQNFNHLSMEDFQAHVLDCFDNDSGPETLQAEMMSDYPPEVSRGGMPGRVCPMCQQRFDLSITQAEFEQHVHRHFGEEPFEVLQT